jgi:hypothetical protein
VASGRLISRSGAVLFGCPVRLPNGVLVDPMVGRSADDAGHYSIGLKPHTIDVPCLDLLLARRANLLDALDARPPRVSFRNLGCWLGVHAAQRGARIAYVPLFRAEVADPRGLAGDRGQALACAWQWMSKLAGINGDARFGLAASHAATFLFR